MKKIKKLKLINWHTFNNEEISFSDINVITGENGTGKSTILDAIHYLQSGGTCKFNTAANTISSGRTVENYLRARVGNENREFLRSEGNIIGHIAIQYFDDLKRKDFILGCVLQLVDYQIREPEFYTILGATWNDDLFFTPDGEIRSFNNLIKEAQLQDLQVEAIISGRKNARMRLQKVQEVLGVNEKYETLFTKAISFQPLDDINRFAIDFLLPEEVINLESIKGSMDNYREIQILLNNELKRKNLLEPIFECANDYEKSIRENDALDLLDIECTIQQEQAKISQIKNDNEKIEKQLADARKNLNEHLEKKSTFEYDARRLEEDENYNILKSTKAKLENVIQKRTDTEESISSVAEKVKQEEENAERIGLSLNLSSSLSSEKYDFLMNNLENYRKKLIAKKEEFNEKENSLRKKYVDFKEKIKITIDSISSLENNSFLFPDYVYKLQNEITKEVKNLKGEDNFRIYTLSNLLSVKEEEWRYAIEGFLGRKRFDLFVPREYRSIAKQCFEKNTEMKKLFGVGVVLDIPEQLELNVNSLASKIQAVRVNKETKKIEVLKEPTLYILSILNDIECVDSIDKFEKGKKAITKEGVYFDGKSIRYVDKEAASIPYLGEESIKIRLASYKKELNALKKKFKSCENELNEYTLLLRLVQSSMCDNLLQLPNYWKDLEDYYKEEELLQNEISKIANSDINLLTRDETINNLRLKANTENEYIREIQALIDKLNGEKGKNLSKIELSEALITEGKTLYHDKYSTYRDNNENIDILLSDLMENSKNEKLTNFVKRRKDACNSNIKNYEKIISNAMLNYNHDFPNELKPEISNYSEYVRRYNKIVNDELAKLEPNVEEARNKSVQELNEHFISKVRNSLINARTDIKKLNSALGKRPFGTNKEVFEFYAQKSSDKLLSSLYHIALETNQDSYSNTIFTEELDAASKETMKKVFEILSTNEEDTEYKNLRKELLDYRNYLNYDIKIHLDNNDTLLYSKNHNSKSGGETQTPFYAMIAGAFQSVLIERERSNYSPCKVVVFDEAFNNMDGERIKQMLMFYRELNIQLIISVPSSRFGYISPYVDQCISLAKVNNKIGIYTSRRISK